MKRPTLITSVKLKDEDIRTIVYWAYNLWQSKGYLLDRDRQVLEILLHECIYRECLCIEELERLRRMLLTR